MKIEKQLILLKQKNGRLLTELKNEKQLRLSGELGLFKRSEVYDILKGFRDINEAMSFFY